MLWAGQSSAGTLEPHEQPRGALLLLFCIPGPASVSPHPDVLPEQSWGPLLAHLTLGRAQGGAQGGSSISNILEMPLRIKGAAESKPREGWGMGYGEIPPGMEIPVTLLAGEGTAGHTALGRIPLGDAISSCSGRFISGLTHGIHRLGCILPRAGAILGAGNTFLCWCLLLGPQSFLLLLSTSGLN